MARGIDVLFMDFCGRVASNDEVVNATCGVHHPARQVHAEFHTSYTGVVPQETVTPAGNVEGNADLSISLFQVDHGTFVIQKPVLVLSHSEDAFAWQGPEMHVDLRKVAAMRTIPARGWLIEDWLRLFEYHST